MRRLLLAGLFLVAGTNAAFCQSQTPAAEEAALGAIWKLHLEATNDHSKVISACQTFKSKSPASLLSPVVDGLAAWHLLKINDAAAATGILEKMLSSPSEAVNKAGAIMAKRWLTRLDREKVRLALKYIYREAIEFPPTLDAMKTLPEAKRGPMVDRWGQTWSYRLTEFKSPNLKNLRGQRYELRSAMLAADSDLAQALARPYAAKINFKADKVIVASPGNETVEFVSTDEKPRKVVLSRGTEADGLSFSFIGSSLVVLSDGDYWTVLPRPK